GAGVAFAAALLRSGALNAGAALLAAAWMLTTMSQGWSLGPPPSWLAVAAALYALSFWTRSLLSRHVLLFSLYLFAVLAYWGDEASFAAPVLLIAASAAIFAFGRVWKAAARRLSGLGDSLPVHALAGFLTGTGTIQMALTDEPGFLYPTILAFAG